MRFVFDEGSCRRASFVAMSYFTDSFIILFSFNLSSNSAFFLFQTFSALPDRPSISVFLCSLPFPSLYTKNSFHYLTKNIWNKVLTGTVLYIILGTPPPCSSIQHCPWWWSLPISTGHHTWYGIRAFIVLGNNSYKALSYSSPCAINSCIHCSSLGNRLTLLLLISWSQTKVIKM